jgi:hypothetical protein
MIHTALSKSEIALRYYKKVAPEKIYTKEQARKQFQQDRTIDKKLVMKIVDEIRSEQKQMLK